jgi:hypothetical protein
MKKLLATTALVVALAAPANAQMNWDPQQYATVVAGLVGYDTKCGGLPYKTKQLANTMSGLISPNEAGPAVMNVMATMDKVGIANWCSTFKPIVAQLEASIQQ